LFFPEFIAQEEHLGVFGFYNLKKKKKTHPIFWGVWIIKSKLMKIEKLIFYLKREKIHFRL